MHIHSSLSSQIAFAPTQSAQQATESRRAAAEVRRKLTSFAATEGDEALSRVDARAEADPDQQRRPQHEEESFKSVFFSASA